MRQRFPVIYQFVSHVKVFIYTGFLTNTDKINCSFFMNSV